MRGIKHPTLDRIELTDVMFALSDPARLEIVRLLAQNRRPMTCQELGGGRIKSTMSRHFKVLRDAGVIRTEAEGKEHLNTLRESELEARFPGVLRSVTKLLREGGG